MDNDTTKKTVYVLWTGTLKQALEDCVGKIKEVFNWKNPDIAEPQEEFAWLLRPKIHLGIYDQKIKQFIQESVIPRIFSDGYTGGVAEKALEMTLNSPLTFGFNLEHGRVFTINELGALDANSVYVTDIDAIKQVLRETYVAGLHLTNFPVNKARIEEMTATVGGGWTTIQAIDIMKIIERELRNNYTYCLKNGKSIVPPEYAKRGKKGIAEWRQLKSKQNKANSLDKQIIKQTLRQAKNNMEECLMKICRCIVCASNASWSVPRLQIDGLYNQQRKRKQVLTLLKGYSKNDIMKMDKQTVLNLAKEYWKNELKQAYDAVDKLKVEDINF